MLEVNEAADQIEKAADKEAIVIFGASVKEDMHDEIIITVIATGFEDRPADILSPSRDKAEAHAKEEEGADHTSEENADRPQDDIFQSKVTGAFDIPSFLSKDKLSF